MASDEQPFSAPKAHNRRKEHHVPPIPTVKPPAVLPRMVRIPSREQDEQNQPATNDAVGDSHQPAQDIDTPTCPPPPTAVKPSKLKINGGFRNRLDQGHQGHQQVTSPTVMPRTKKPPSYDQAKKCPLANPDDLKEGELGSSFVLSSDSSSESSSEDDEDQTCRKHPPSVERLKQIETENQTICKTLAMGSDTRNQAPSPAVDSAKNVMLGGDEQLELLGIVRQLQKEQDSLREKLREHDDHLQSLLHKKPSIRRSIRKTACNKKGRKTKMTVGEYEDEETQHLCVQIEHLYTNFCKMHVPANTLRTILDINQPSEESNTRDQAGFARTRETADGYWEVVTVQENVDLMKENEELQRMVRDLKDELSKSQAEDKPADMSQTLPVLHKMPKAIQKKTEISKFAVNAIGVSIGGGPVSNEPNTDPVLHTGTTFEWCIYDYYGKYSNERFGKVLKVVSNPFYISHYGYRVQLEAYLNGKGESQQDKCASLFLKVIKGSYDDKLNWPVRLRLSATLVNQTARRGQSHRADPHAFEYRKPSGSSDDSCDCHGYIEFVAHSVIGQRKYILNDSILIETKLRIL